MCSSFIYNMGPAKSAAKAESQRPGQKRITPEKREAQAVEPEPCENQPIRLIAIGTAFATTTVAAPAAAATITTATAAAAAAGGTVFARLSSVNGQSTTIQLSAVKGLNGLFSFF